MLLNYNVFSIATQLHSQTR